MTQVHDAADTTVEHGTFLLADRDGAIGRDEKFGPGT